MACCERLRSSCKGSARSEHGSMMWRGLRPFGNAQTITRCGEPMQLSIVGKNFSPKIAPNSALRAFDGLCDDEAVPLICPDVSSICAKRIPAGDCLLPCMGLFSIFWWGATVAWRREIRLEAAHFGEACSWSSATSKVAATRSRRARGRTCSSCTMFQKRPDHRMAAQKTDPQAVLAFCTELARSERFELVL
jgi:hypothetical protein